MLSTVTNMAHTSVVLYEPKKGVIVNDIVPPLDYSFLKIQSVEECESEEPRDNSPRKQAASKKKIQDEDVEEKSNSLCLKLNNNEIKDLNNLMATAISIFNHPANIGWIDLSFNCLAQIDPVLTQFENLKILYLHGNYIKDPKEVNKLAGIPKLRKLTLHGNEIETIKGYRFYMLSLLPNLVSFDFSPVTKGDRMTAQTLNKFNNPTKRKKLDDD